MNNRKTGNNSCYQNYLYKETVKLPFLGSVSTQANASYRPNFERASF